MWLPGLDPRLRVAVPALAAAWLVPTGTDLLGIDWLLLPVMLLGTASLIRVGSTLLDRVMVAAGVLAGGLICAGLGFSYWPWGLDPLPVAGVVLSTLVVVSALLGRAPELPPRLRGSDLIALLAGAAVVLIGLSPFRGLGYPDVLVFAVRDEDQIRHFALVDTIQRIGGFPFLHPERARPSLEQPTEMVYPSGSHYLTALIDNFVRSTGDLGDPQDAYLRVFLYLICGCAFLTAALVWGAAWLAGPGSSGWRRSTVAATVAGLAATGYVVMIMLIQGFYSEVYGLAFLALAVVLIARPAARVREQVLIVCMLLIAVAYCYNLFLVPATVGALIALVVQRKRLLRDRWFVGVAAVVFGAIALTPVVLPQLTGFSQADQLLAVTGLARTPRTLLVTVCALGLAGALTRAGRRSSVWRVWRWQVALTLVVLVAFKLYQRAILHGGSAYYFEKALHGTTIVALVGLGSCVHLVRADAFGTVARTVRGRVLSWTAAVTAGALITGAISFTTPIDYEGGINEDSTWASVWIDRRPRNVPYHWELIKLQKLGYFGDGIPTLVFSDERGRNNRRLTMFLSVQNHNMGVMTPLMNVMLSTDALGGKNVRGVRAGTFTPAAEEAWQGLRAALLANRLPLRVVVANPDLAVRLRALATAAPQARLDIVLRPELQDETGNLYLKFDGIKPTAVPTDPAARP
jgi:hypothetical protein